MMTLEDSAIQIAIIGAGWIFFTWAQHTANKRRRVFFSTATQESKREGTGERLLTGEIA